MNNEFKIIEKKNRLALHALCFSRSSAERWIENIRRELNQGVNYFDDKTLTADSFEIVAPAWEATQ